MPWTLDLHKSIASTAGSMACTLVQGPSITFDERGVVPWLASSLLRTGIEAETLKFPVPKKKGGDKEEAEGSDSKKDAPLGADGKPLDQFQDVENEVLDGVPSDSLDTSAFALGKASSASAAGGAGAGAGAAASPRSLKDAVRRVGKAKAADAVAERRAWFQKMVAGCYKKKSGIRKFLELLKSCAADIFATKKHASTEAFVLLALLLHTGTWLEARQWVEKMEEEGAAFDDSEVEVSPEMLTVYAELRAVRSHLASRESDLRMGGGDDKAAAAAAAAAASDESKEGDGTEESKEGEDGEGGSSKSSASSKRRKRKIQVPMTAADLRTYAVQRAQFLLSLPPCATSPGQSERAAISQLKEKWSNQLPMTTLQPLLKRWKSTEQANVASGEEKWGSMITLLRRQNSWEKRDGADELLDDSQVVRACVEVLL